jgi:Protein of unknown function (DUF3604)
VTRPLVWLVLVLTGATACRPSRSKDAKTETLETLESDLAAARHASDGAGEATLIDAPAPLRVSQTARFEIRYVAGPLGIDVGGALFLEPSPFWGWDPPQADVERGPGYTTATTEAPGVELESSSAQGILALHVRGRRLEPGATVRIVYGAGPAGARVDRFAERNARIWIAVDGDGDGVRAVLPDSPAVDVLAGPPARLLVTLPTIARPGDRVRANVVVLDAAGNAGPPFAGDVALAVPDGLDFPSTVHFDPSDAGVRVVQATATRPGVYRLRAAETALGLACESNPLVVNEGIPRILWGDLHGHSQLSDGTGTPDDYFTYARDVAALDVAALTDHDHWGMEFLDQHPELFRTVVDAARKIDEPGRFVAIAGYEWTSWLEGHRHVLFFDGGETIWSSLDPRYATPPLLWKALSGRRALTVAHHSAGGPVSTNWAFRPPPSIEPVTEIVSVHGSSEAADTPGKIYDAVEGNFVRDALEDGLRFGFIGSGDSHDGHPGLAQFAAPGGGLAAIFSEDATRGAILDALRARRVYATNGPRIWLRTWLDEAPMGSTVTPRETGTLRFAVAATAPVARVDVVRSGSVVAVVSGERRRELSSTLPLAGLRDGEYVYVRVVQEDGGVAWASPFFVSSFDPRD